MNGDFFEFIFWLVAILIWFFSSLAKKKKPQGQPWQGPAQERRPSSLEEKILESLGLKIPQAPQSPVQVTIKPKAYQPTAAKKKEEKITSLQRKEAVLPAPAPEVKAGPGEFLNLDKLEEGIILSIILGPPKAYTFQPGWRNGRHVGLKNQ